MNIKSRYLLTLVIVLFLVSIISAVAGVVTINPANPIDSDDLTCYLNGVVCNSAIACTPKWTSSSFSGELFFNPLLNPYTSANTVVTCTAWVQSVPNSIEAGSASVLVSPNPLPPPPNTPPNINGRIPDYNVNENSGLNNDLVYLWNYVSDAETPTNQLNFTIVQQSNPSVINCVIDDQRNNITNPGVFIDCTTQLNQIGYSDITIRVNDSGGLWAEDVFRVNVIGVNNPPTILFLPDVTITEDSGLNLNLIDLWNYVSDAETPTNQLVFTITSETGLLITDCSIRNNRYIECLTLLNQNGVSDVSVQVQDGVGLTASDVFRVTVVPVNDAPIVNNIPDVSMFEDLPNSAIPLIDLDNFVNDPENDPITWSAVSNNPNLTVIVNPDNSISYVLGTNWFGIATVNFTATDSGGLFSSDSSTIVVNPVNDIPTLSGLPDQIFLEDFGTVTNIIDLWNYALDIETPSNQLTYSIFSESAPGIVNCNINSNRYIDCVSQLNQNGFSDVTIQVSDLLGTAVDTFRITINPVNDIPTINPAIPNQVMHEDHHPWDLDLTSYGNDIEDLQTQLVWSVSGVDLTLYNTSITNRVITFTSVANACGNDSITLTVTDTNGATTSQNINVTLTCVNDIPTINPVIPDQNRNEDALPWNLDLTSYGNDIENIQTQLVWSVVGVDTTLFITSFDVTNRIITFTPVANASGSNVINLTVNDLNGGIASQNIRVTLNPVNDLPWISPIIPNQIRNEGSAPWGIDLNLYEHDVEDLGINLTWIVSGVNNNLMSVTIDPVTHIATFILNNSDVSGSNTITFTLTDLQGASVSQNVLVTITPINDAPVVSDIPNVNFNEDTTYTSVWNLNNYVNDVDNLDSQLIWSVSGNTNVSYIINPNGTVTFSATPNWNGAEVLVFRATDPSGLYSEDSVIVSVNSINDAPVVSNIPNLMIPEDGIDFSINLNNYVADPDNTDAQINWSFSGNNNISIYVDPATRMVIFSPLANWIGSETINFTACDPSMLCNSDSTTVTVTSVNDAPVVSDIPNINFNEDTTYILDLNPYVSDLDNSDSQITWSVLGATNININIVAGIATISAPLNWNGFETITFIATDPSSSSDSDNSIILVNAVNDIPTINPVIPDQTRNEDSLPWSLDLTSYGNDIEDAQTNLIWSVSGVDTTMYTTSISNRIITFTPLTNACGSDSITLTVTDLQSASASQNINVNLNCINDAPIISDIPDVQIQEDSTPITLIQLDNFVSDIETSGANMVWTYSPVPANIGISIDPISHAVTFSVLTPNYNGNTTITFRATDSGGLYVEDTVTVIVVPVNDAPIVSDIPNTNFNEDSTTTISLDSFVSDIDNTPAQMTWSATGNPDVIVNINPATHVASLSAPLNWNGANTLNFTACDLGGLCDSDISVVTVNPVNDAPVVNMPDMITIPEDSNVNLVLNGYVTDVDNLVSQINWSVTGNVNINVIVDNMNKLVSIIPNANWFGVETLTFTATDINGASGSDVLIINVSSVNDSPVINSFNPVNGTVTLNEGSSQLFSISASDIDGPSLIYSWVLDGVVIPGAITNNYNYNAINGISNHVLTSAVSDGSLNVSNTWNINVNNVPPQAVSANGPYTCAIGSTVMLSGSATDPGTLDVLTYSWDFNNDGTTDSVGQNVFFPCASVGLSNVNLRVSDGTNSVNATTTVMTYDIAINEISPNPVSGNDWVELYNNDPVNSFTLNNWELRDTGATPMATIVGQTILPNGFLVVSVGARLNNGTDSIRLLDNLGNLIDNYNYTGLTFANITEGRIPNGFGGFTQNIPTPGASNIALVGVNLPPIANAGADQNIITGNLVLLNGNLSSDPNAGNVLSYSWNISSAPVGSVASLIGANTINPNFTPDVNGIYVIELRVSDNGVPILSDSDVAIISASNITNSAPVINSVNIIPSVVNINGLLACVVSASDPNGDPVILTYRWTTNNPLVNLSTFTTSTLDLSLVPNENYGNIINCTVTPNDGILTGASASDVSSIALNSAPVASIISPINNSNYTAGNVINFFGTGLDSEEGLLSGAQLQWRSNIDGIIGTGNAFSTNTLSVNTHLINLTVCDSTLLCDSTTVRITINPVVINNTAPVIAGISNQSLLMNSGLNGNIIDLWAFTNDAETADSGLTYSVVAQTGLAVVNCGVSSNRFINCTTQAGQTGISDVTIQVQDPSLATDTAVFRVNVTSAVVNQNPTIVITSPATGSSFTQGTPVNFVATANDFEDGVITANIKWYSSINGLFGIGGNLNINTLSQGIHVITARINDSSSNSVNSSRTITITPPGGQTIINSLVDGIYYASAYDTDPQFPTITNSSVINTTVSNGALPSNSFNISFSYISNSTILRGANISNCVILDSVFGGICSGSFIDPTYIDGTSSVTTSTITDSDVINYSVVVNSNVVNSLINNSTVINSAITNSQLIEFNVNGVTITNNIIIGSTGTINGIPAINGHNISEYKNSAPVAVINANQTSGVDLVNVNFSAFGSSDVNVDIILNDIISYSWNFGDGNYGTGISAVHQYGVGTFNAVLTVTDKFNAKDTKTATITVSSSTAPSSGGGGGGGGGGGSSGCSINIKELTTKTILTRNLCTIMFTYNNIKYEAKIKDVNANLLTVGLGDLQASAGLNKESRLSLTANKDLIFSYDKLDFGKVVTTLSIGDKIKTTPVVKPVTTTTPTTITSETKTVPKENTTPTGAVVVSGIRKNAIGIVIMFAIILIGSVIYFFIKKKN